MAISHARDLAPTAPPAASSRPHAARLGGDVVLVSWDVLQAPRAPAALRAAGLPVAPTASLRLRRRDGGARLVWVLRRPAGRGLLISLHAGAAGPVREVDLDGDLPALDPADLLRGLDPEGGVAIVSAMVNVWAPLFRLEANRAFAAALRHVLLALAPRPKPAAVLAKATEDLVLLGARLPERVRRIEAIHVVGSAGIVRLAGDPHLTPAGPDGALQMHVLAEAAALPDEAALLAVTGPGGLSVRLLPDPRSPGRAPGAVRRPPGLVAWLRERGEAAPVLRQRLLTDLAARSEAAARSPWRRSCARRWRRSASRAASPPSPPRS
jgi:hypothetical protein